MHKICSVCKQFKQHNLKLKKIDFLNVVSFLKIEEMQIQNSQH